MRSVYDPATGVFTGQRLQGAIAPAAGLAEMEGEFDPLSQCVDLATGQVVAWQPPDTPEIARAMAAAEAAASLLQGRIAAE